MKKLYPDLREVLNHWHTLRSNAVKLPARETITWAYSYLRFSSPPQADGDSTRRQTSLSDGWLKRHPDVRLDTSLKLADYATSGYTGQHRTDLRYALAQFCDLVRRERVPVGSYLLLENLDRFSREELEDALPAIFDLLKAGIRIVQLSPTEVVYESGMDLGRLFMMILELARGHAESKRKSSMLGPAWKEKKALARAKKIPIGRQTPEWIVLEKDRYRVRPEAARAIRLIFRWTGDGLSLTAVTQRLEREKVPVIAAPRKARKPGLKRRPQWGQCWSRSYVHRILQNRAVLGEYQPMNGSRRGRTLDGNAVSGYFPAIIKEKEWHRAQAAIAARRNREGRPQKETRQPRLFSGLLSCALDRGPLYVCSRASVASPTGREEFLFSSKAGQGEPGAHWCTFPVASFETEILAQLQELRAAELFADPGSAAMEEVMGELLDAEKRLAAALELLDSDPDSPDFKDRAKRWNQRKRALVLRQMELTQQAAHPLSAVWTEAVEEMKRKHPQRLRAALLQTIDTIWCLLVRRGKERRRLLMAQVHFQGGACRTYFLLHEDAYQTYQGRRPARSRSGSLAGFPLPKDLDLRQPDHARRLYDRLLAQTEWRIDEAKAGRQ